MDKPYALKSWNELFAQHERFVFRLAYDLVHDRHLAEDLVQQTWLTAIERPPTARRSLKGWLATVLRNLAIDHFRTDRRPRAQADDELPHGAQPSYADEEEASAIRQSVLDSLHELDPIYREVLHLHYIEGQTLAMVAETLSLPLETARTRCRRGLSRLRGRLDRRYRGRRPWVAALAPFALPRTGTGPGTGPDAASSGGASTGASSRTIRAGSGATISARLLPAAFVLVPVLALVAFVALALTRDARPSLAAAGPALVDAGPRENARLVGADEPASRVALLAPQPTSDLAAASLGSTRLRVLHAATDEPLGGVRVLMQTESSEVHAESPVLVSDGEGWIDLDVVGPGRWTVRPERGQALLVDLPRRDSEPLEVRVPDGIEVRGRVVDATGAALPFASVHLTWPGWIRVHEVATCDADGAFHVPRMDPASLIAGGDEFGYGWLVSFDSPPYAGLATVRAELAVPDPGRVIEGVVVDPSGRPVAGARVRGLGRLRTTFSAPDPLVGEPGGLPPPGEIATTDERGRFRLGHFRDDVDRIPVSAWAEGFARASADASDGPLEIRLEPEAVVEGTVLARDGAPVAWARVSARVPGHPQPSIVRADAQGRYRLARLPAGRIAVEALSDRSGSEGWIESELELRSGRTTRWDPVLGEVARIRGQALDAVGRPLAGWVVQVVAEPHIESYRATGRFNENRLIRSTLTDEQGGFAFFGCRPVRHLVKAYAPDDASGYPRAWAWGAVPDAADVLLRADEATAPRSGLRGRLVFPDGAAPESAQVTLYSRLVGRSIAFDAAKGSGIFDTGPLPADTYQMLVWAVPGGSVKCPAVELGPGEVLELGDLLIEVDAEPQAAPARR